MAICAPYCVFCPFCAFLYANFGPAKERNGKRPVSTFPYLLGEEEGKIGSIEDIQTTTVNGDPLPVNGYLDIGLNDTMTDMLFEGLGALIYAVIYMAGKGKHPVIYKAAEEQPANAL